MQIKFYSSKALLFIVFLIMPFLGFSQEYLNELSENIQIKKSLKSQPHIFKTGVNSVIELPFFDDFSTDSIFPDEINWLDRTVYINDNYGINHPTVNVATFDAINQYGRLYAFPDTASTMNGDTLTSTYINASSYLVSDSLYLSFFVQGGGMGNIPQTKDSIFLQFKYKSTDTTYWKTVWSKLGEQMQNFEAVIIPLNEQEFIHDSLQFRFINKFSLEYAGMNCDHWNLDYIYLDAGRSVNDSLIDEVAYTENVNKIFNSYSAVPWRDYKLFYNDIVDAALLRFRNYKEQVMNMTPYIKWTNLYTNDSDSVGTIANNYQPNTYYEQEFQITNNLFELNDSDSARFKLETKYIISENDYPGNNKTSRIIDFYNYYAYDDGSAEGMYGVSNKFGMIAVKFNTFSQDSLKAVRIFFNNSKNDENRYFNLMVWDEGGAGPGEVLYKKTRNKPADTINDFVTYEFDSAVAVGTTFYIGWQKITDLRLNMGFDKNFIAYQKNYYNANGSWELSQFEGSLMIRPVMREMFAFKNTYDEIQEPELDNTRFKIYPNPLSKDGLLHIQTSIETYTVKVFDQLGRLILDQHQDGVVDMSQFETGLYIVRLSAQNENYTYKIIKQ